jgi:hypothetical protein
VKRRDAEQPFYVFRVRADAKKPIREHLEGALGIRASVLFPDFSGFGRFAVNELASA